MIAMTARFTGTARFAALAFGVAIAGMTPAASPAAEVNEACRTSVHQAGGPASTAPDICAGIESPADGPARILDVASTVDALADAANAADFVLLGETHDNPSHHRVRGQIILAMAARREKAKRRAPGLVLEHIRADQALAVAGLYALDKIRRRTADDVFTALDWKKSGWPDQALFQPMISAAMDAEWPLLHGNVTRNAIRSVAKGGVAALDASEAKRLGLDTPLAETAQNELLDELVESHCGLMPRVALTTMADAQRYRDAYMAAQLVDAAKIHDGAVLLAGNGHVQSDRAVPWHLQRMAPDKRTLVVFFAQANRDRSDVLTYVNRAPTGKPIADFVVVTPRVERPDPCEAMRKRFSAPKK